MTAEILSPEALVDSALVEFAGLTHLTPTMTAELRRLILAGRSSTARRHWRQYVERGATIVDQRAALRL